MISDREDRIINRDNKIPSVREVEREKEKLDIVTGTNDITNTPEEKRRVTVELNEEQFSILQKLQEYYRCPSYSHTVRLALVDAAKGIEQDAPGSRFTTEEPPKEGLKD